MINHIKKAAGYSLGGLRAAIQEEEAFRIVLWETALVLALVLYFPLSYAARAIILLSVFICNIVELFNSALENAVDLTTGDWHILAKKAKDMGSAAQFVAQLSLGVQIALAFWYI